MNERACGTAGNKLSPWRKTRSDVNMTTTNPTRNGLMSNTGFQFEWSAGNGIIKFHPQNVSTLATYAHSINKVQTCYFLVSASLAALICTLHQMQSLSEIISIVKPTRCTNASNLFYFGMTLYMFRTVFPSINRNSRLYIKQKALFRQIRLSAC